MLCAFINTLPSQTREKLELRWSVSAIFFLGLIRILLSFEAIVPFPGCVLLEVILRILAIQFMLENIRRLWPLSDVPKPSPYVHLPIAAFFILLFTLSDGENRVIINLLTGAIKLLLCLTIFKATEKNLFVTGRYKNLSIGLGALICALQTIIFLLATKEQPLFEQAISNANLFHLANAEIIAILLLCTILIAERAYYDYHQKSYKGHTLAILSPALIFTSILFISTAGIKIGQTVATREKEHIQSEMDKSVHSLTLLINQRIIIASKSSGILSAAPVMADFLKNSSPEKAKQLKQFLKRFSSSTPGSVCYLMDSLGSVVASSELESQFSGKNFSFRNYFQQPMSGIPGSMIDYGVLTNLLGFFSSHPVRDPETSKILGVCCVRTNINDLEDSLKLYHPSMLINDQGVVFLASDKKLTGKQLEIPGLSTENASNTMPYQHACRFNGITYMQSSSEIGKPNWRLLMLVKAEQVNQSQKWIMIIILLVVFIFIVILTGMIRTGEAFGSFELAQSQFKLLFDNAPESILVVSLVTLEIREANASMLRQFELSSAAGLNYFELMPATNRKITNAQHYPHEKIFKHERNFKKKSGDTFLADVTGSIIEYNHEKSLLLILHDISLHKQIENKLIEAKTSAEEASMLKTRFFANASHEIRTPMTAIIGLTELANSMCKTEDQKKILGLVSISAKSLLTLINDILEIAQIRTGQLQISHTQFNLHLLLKDVFDIIALQSDPKNVITSLTIDPDVPQTVVSDPDRIRQIIMNLLTNAVKFTPKGKITLNVSSSELQNAGHLITFEVSDTGGGLSEEAEAGLFKVFGQTDLYLRGERKHAGLSLSISKKIVELLGGKIDAHGKFAHGTTFRLSIPMQAISTPTTQQADPDISKIKLVKQGQPLKFLVADDNEINLFLASSIIEKFEGVSKCFKDGIETLRDFAENDYDALLIDIQMPKMDGITTIKEIRKMPGSKAEIPIIAVSAFASEHEKNMACEAGANHYLSKPYFPEDLVKAIRLVLKQKNSETEAESDFALSSDSAEKGLKPSASLQQINQKEFELRVLKKPENILQICDIFSRRSEALLNSLESSLTEQDCVKLRETAHSIKGLTGMLAASNVFELARNIESLSKDGNFTEAAALVPELKTKIIEIASDLVILRREAEKKLV